MPNIAAQPAQQPDPEPDIPAEVKKRGKIALNELASVDKGVSRVAAPSEPVAYEPAVFAQPTPAAEVSANNLKLGKKVHWKTRQKQEQEAAKAAKSTKGKAKKATADWTVTITVRKEDKRGNVSHEKRSIVVDPAHPQRGLSREQILEVHATTYPDAPLYDKMLGDVTPAFRAWLKTNHPGAAAIRYYERPE
jgi:hypothetical protein